MLSNRTLKDLTQLLDPYKRNTSDSPLRTLNHLIHCHDRTSQLLQTLDLDSQRITQSSKAIQSALESMKILFNTLILSLNHLSGNQISLIFTRYWYTFDTFLNWTFLILSTGNIFLLRSIFDSTLYPFWYTTFDLHYIYVSTLFSTLFESSSHLIYRTKRTTYYSTKLYNKKLLDFCLQNRRPTVTLHDVRF